MTLVDRAMPDFLGIGAQRAGTTWLWAHLRRHPRIWTPGRKELHFFDRSVTDGAGWWDRLRYAAWFVPGRLRGRVVGEVTPAYATLPDDRVTLIATWMPRVKVIYLLRDPIERAWSQAAKGFVRWAGRDLAQATDDDLRAYFQLPEVKIRGDYAFAIGTWRRHFPADQTLVCVSENLFADPVGQLRAVFAFLNVDPALRLDAARLRAPIHAGRTPPVPPVVREMLEPEMIAQRDALESMLEIRLPWGR